MNTLIVQCNCGWEVIDVNVNCEVKDICPDCACFYYVKKVNSLDKLRMSKINDNSN